MSNNAPHPTINGDNVAQVLNELALALDLSPVDLAVIRTLEQMMSEKRETIAKLREELEGLNNEERTNNETLDNYNKLSHIQNMKLIWTHEHVLKMYSELQKSTQKGNQSTGSGSQ